VSLPLLHPSSPNWFLESLGLGNTQDLYPEHQQQAALGEKEAEHSTYQNATAFQIFNAKRVCKVRKQIKKVSYGCLSVGMEEYCMKADTAGLQHHVGRKSCTSIAFLSGKKKLLSSIC
jgi:hypothetical protein